MSTSSAQISILQAMGVDVYQSYKEKPPLPAIAEKAWFSDLLSLLNINEDHCTFTDDSPISFAIVYFALTERFLGRSIYFANHYSHPIAEYVC